MGAFKLTTSGQVVRISNLIFVPFMDTHELEDILNQIISHAFQGEERSTIKVELATRNQLRVSREVLPRLLIKQTDSEEGVEIWETQKRVWEQTCVLREERIAAESITSKFSRRHLQNSSV